MLTTSSSVSSFTYKPKLANLTAINHSQFSILNAMDRFVNSVEKMQNTILVPSRLKDLQLDNEQISLLGQSDAYGLYMMLDEIKNELLWGPTTGSSSVAMQLASNFNNLTLTSDLSSTPKENSPIQIKQLQQSKMIKCGSSASLSFCDPIKRLKKQRTFSSTDDGFSSMHEGSSNSLALSDDDSNDSIDVTSESEDSETGSLQINTNKNKLESSSSSSSVESKDTFHLTAAFRLHLRGLSALCTQLADTAEFITEKYQNELN